MKKRIIGATLLTVVCALLISNLVGVLMFRSREVEAARENLRELLILMDAQSAITDPEGIEDKHFLDSLLFASQPEVAGKMVDVGAGAGFPGIVTKIYKPELELTLMEPTGKRVEFLKYACGQLGLTGVEFAKERAEEAARKVWREQFDLASARAVAALPMLAEYCLPLVKVGGNFLAMKGASGEEELAAARGAIKKLGGEYRETRTLHLPGGDTRTLILCKKISQTPTAYPRNGGKIAKSPLK